MGRCLSQDSHNSQNLTMTAYGRSYGGLNSGSGQVNVWLAFIRINDENTQIRIPRSPAYKQSFILKRIPHSDFDGSEAM